MQFKMSDTTFSSSFSKCINIGWSMSVLFRSGTDRESEEDATEVENEAEESDSNKDEDEEEVEDEGAAEATEVENEAEESGSNDTFELGGIDSWTFLSTILAVLPVTALKSPNLLIDSTTENTFPKRLLDLLKVAFCDDISST